MRQKNVFLLLWVTLTCVACSSTLPSFKSYKLDIQQGNVVTSKMMDQVRPGMSKSQVKYVLGTPLIQDTFHRDRWDYLYQYRHEGKITQQNRVILYFKNDMLDKIAGDPIPEGTLDPASLPKSDVMLEQADKRTFVEKLKFWNARESAPNNALIAKAASEETDDGSLLDKLKFWKSSETEVASNTSVTKAKDSASEVQAVKPEQAAESVPEKIATAKTEEDATSSLLAVPIEAVAAASIAGAVEQSAQAAEVAQPAKETVAEVVTPVAEATAVASAPAEHEPNIPAPVVEAKPEMVPPKEEVVVAPEPSPVATVLENKSEMPEVDVVYQSYNAQLEPPTLLLDKKLKKLSDKPIAKINATPDIPPQLRLSRTLADAPSMVVPVSEVPLKPSPKAKMPSPPDTSEPGIFERMLEKIGF